jgi:hypothetical protein
MMTLFDIYDMFKRGRDTSQIASVFGVKESEVYNLLPKALAEARRLSAHPNPNLLYPSRVAYQTEETTTCPSRPAKSAAPKPASTS